MASVRTPATGGSTARAPQTPALAAEVEELWMRESPSRRSRRRGAPWRGCRPRMASCARRSPRRSATRRGRR